MPAITGEITRPCPQCGVEMRVDDRFTVWCAACDWNVDPEGQGPDASRLERAARALARRHGEQLLAEMGSGRDPRPRRDASALIGTALALTVHGVTLALAVGGVWCVVAGWGGVGVVAGLVLLVLAWGLAPRVQRLPDDRPVLFRSDAPELFALLDEVARSVGTRGVHAIAVDASINAAVTTYGVRGRRLLVLGMPLWEVLTPGERIALLGHELAHYANGDTRNGLVVGTAVRSLALWHHTLQPLPQPSGIEMAVNALYVVPRLLVRAVLVLLVRLTSRAGIRAEYLADRLAARTASTQEAVNLMDRLLITRALGVLLRAEASRAALGGTRSAREAAARAGDVWERLRAYAASVPEHEYERQRRVGTLRGHQVDATHPPTHLRRACLLTGTPEAAAVVPQAHRTERIAAELAEARTETARRLLRDGLDD
ncbi:MULTISPECIES: M48 family metallopeptidase [Streptomyces]|nr:MULTISPECIES: M48 family metallopeptidase [Streptomyces]MBP5863120.1 M48 family metalloprotease [Streptomyces sp. LBUM 1484]MBP5876397.1 M48 family metalloprotease [Streptomyces sp. LBUM 1477]MBP5884143.1 M48 family metalloprotease [Streptomyces sp. LBUM 1487]MBP5893037.1 M48 family metalloprotease [Streptomyces sp. LBUM 1481]MBP5900157.1 M48 family metalloprotease [Streptomyces sp. LBUM 1488]